jgi:hypothetical protein
MKVAFVGEMAQSLVSGDHPPDQRSKLAEQLEVAGLLSPEFQKRLFRLWGNLTFCDARRGGAFTAREPGSRGINAAAVCMQIDNFRQSTSWPPLTKLRTTLGQYQPPAETSSLGPAQPPRTLEV